MVEDAEHVVFECGRFLERRRQLESILGEALTVGNLVPHMLQSPKNWENISRFAASIMIDLRRNIATEQKIPAKRSKAVRAKGHDQEELPEVLMRYRRLEGTTSILNGWVVAWVLGDRRVKEVPSSSAPSPGWPS
ncbi:hypothetical protein ACLKA7_000739 [Drosophila subpalustris]